MKFFVNKPVYLDDIKILKRPPQFLDVINLSDTDEFIPFVVIKTWHDPRDLKKVWYVDAVDRSGFISRIQYYELVVLDKTSKIVSSFYDEMVNKFNIDQEGVEYTIRTYYKNNKSENL